MQNPFGQQQARADVIMAGEGFKDVTGSLKFPLQNNGANKK